MFFTHIDASTASMVRKHLFDPSNKVTTRRDLLSYGTGGAVDQILFRLVRDGLLIRVARGVYVRSGTVLTSLEIIQLKALSFARALFGNAPESPAARSSSKTQTDTNECDQ